jgi:hypothetical protein
VGFGIADRSGNNTDSVEIIDLAANALDCPPQPKFPQRIYGPGTNVMILKKFSPKQFAKKWRFLFKILLFL